MPKEIKQISFIAALNNSTAIKIDGEGQCKVTFEVPASEMPNVIKLVLKVGQTFRVIIEDDKGN
jgi:hypothetical protein